MGGVSTNGTWSHGFVDSLLLYSDAGTAADPTGSTVVQVNAGDAGKFYDLRGTAYERVACLIAPGSDVTVAEGSIWGRFGPVADYRWVELDTFSLTIVAGTQQAALVDLNLYGECTALYAEVTTNTGTAALKIYMSFDGVRT